MSAITQRFTLRPFHFWVAFLAILIAGGLYGAAVVFIEGLVVTNLTDLVPWGLWITIDLSAIAMSAGAFLLCAGVYLLGLKQYQPLARTATWIGLTGYSMAVMTLLLDIGRPDRFYHALIYWNTHSLLWEVTMCVTLYFTVLLLEVAPIFGETPFMQNRFPKVSGLLIKIHHLAPYLAIVGLCLSMLHQSSLGATYGVLKARPIWYRPDMSVLFMASAIAAGPALTAFVSMLSARLTKRAIVNDHLIERLSYFVGWVCVGYLYFRFWDALSMTYTYEPGRTESLAMLTKGSLSFSFWVFEILLGALVPIIILLKAKYRHNPTLRMFALACVPLGVIAYRWDVNMAGQLTLLTYLPNEMRALYTTYVPSLMEILSGAGVVAYGFMMVTLGVYYLNIVNHSHGLHEAAHADDPVEPEASLAPAD